MIKEKLCTIIVDNGSYNNITSQELVDRMELKQRRHPNPYKMQRLNDCGALRVNHVMTDPFSMGGIMIMWSAMWCLYNHANYC